MCHRSRRVAVWFLYRYRMVGVSALLLYSRAKRGIYHLPLECVASTWSILSNDSDSESLHGSLERHILGVLGPNDGEIVESLIIEIYPFSRISCVTAGRAIGDMSEELKTFRSAKESPGIRIFTYNPSKLLEGCWKRDKMIDELSILAEWTKVPTPCPKNWKSK